MRPTIQTSLAGKHPMAGDNKYLYLLNAVNGHIYGRAYEYHPISEWSDHDQYTP